LAPHVEKHLANHILSRGFIPDEAQHKPEHPHVMTRVQDLHGKPIAVRYSSNQQVV
jgi:predicted metal-dependent hydrolase